MRNLKLPQNQNTKKVVLTKEEESLWIQIRSDNDYAVFTDKEIDYLFQIAKQYHSIEIVSFETILTAGKEGLLKAKAKLYPTQKPLKRATMLIEFIRQSIVEKLAKN